MDYRIFSIHLLFPGLLLLGCEKPARGEKPAAVPQSHFAKAKKIGAETEKEKTEPIEKGRDKSAAAENKSAALKRRFEKFGFKWSDEKESDFPLVIKLETPPVPEEIIGPFPENAGWRTKETAPEKKPEKKSAKRLLSWK